MIGSLRLIGELPEELGMRLTIDIISYCSSIRSPLIRIVETTSQI